MADSNAKVSAVKEEVEPSINKPCIANTLNSPACPTSRIHAAAPHAARAPPSECTTTLHSLHRLKEYPLPATRCTQPVARHMQPCLARCKLVRTTCTRSTLSQPQINICLCALCHSHSFYVWSCFWGDDDSQSSETHRWWHEATTTTPAKDP